MNLISVFMHFPLQVNHFPGSGYLTNKVILATSHIGHIPKAFKIPDQADELQASAKEHPETMWVQKSSNHRGIKIKTMEGGLLRLF